MDEHGRAPGWYPDPWGGDGERYFDGTSWSRDESRTPSPPTARSGRRPLMWMLGGLVAAIAVAAIVFVTVGNDSDSSNERHATAPPSEASSTTTTQPEFILKSFDAGDCATWDQTKPGAVAHIVDCSEPHLMELVKTKRVDDMFDHYPTEDEWRFVDATVCAPVVERYLKRPIDPSDRYYAGGVRPTEKSWDRGDRSIDCGITLNQASGPDQQLVAFSGRVDPR